MHEIVSNLLRKIPVEMLITLAGLSIFMFVGTLIAIPVILIRLPADYFNPRVPRAWMHGRHPVLRFVGQAVKNLAGVVFLLAGFAMLVLPGQGLLTILIGLSLIDFPGKRHLEARIVGQPALLKLINSMRRKFGRPDLVV